MILLTNTMILETSLPLLELLTPSKQSRAKGDPRPQNQFMLYCRNISKGLCKIDSPMLVGDFPRASVLWKSLSERVRIFGDNCL